MTAAAEQLAAADQIIMRNLTLLFRTFTPVEERILSEVANVLSPEVRQTFNQQVAAINHVQRLLESHEVSFYTLRKRKPVRNQSIAFPNEGEFTLANADFVIDDTRFKSQLICVNGFVFTLVVRPSIKRFWHKHISTISVTLITNPTEMKHGNHQASLPESYLQWLAHTQSGQNHGWTIFLPEETYVIHLADADYIVLANRECEEFILVRLDSKESAFYHAESNHSVPSRIADSFELALES